MQFRTAIVALLLPALGLAADEVKTDFTLTHTCKRATQRGDSIQVHYRGTLAANGEQFDASYDRGQPLAFTVGSGMVIKGWDEGLLDMCPGDKRKLTIPPEFGYGQRAMGPIPAGSTLVFETELVEIVGIEKEDKVVKESGTAPEEPEAQASAEAEGAVPVEEGDKDEL